MSMVQKYRSCLVLAVAVAGVTLVISGDAALLDKSLLVATSALLALSLGFCYGQAGMLSAAQAALAAMGAYTTAILATRYDVPAFLGLAGAIVVPTAVAWALGRLVVRLSPLALVLATMTLSQLLTIVLGRGGDFTGGYIGISGIPAPTYLDTPLKAHLVAWGLVLLVTVLLVRLQRSDEGRALRLVHHDPTLARSLGIPVSRRLTAVFAFSAAVAGVAGWLYAHTRLFLASDSLPLGLSITAFIMLAVGGKTAALGPTVGALTLVVVGELLPSAEVQGMFYGVILAVVVLLFPHGIMGTDWLATGRRLLRGRAPSHNQPAPASSTAVERVS